jgi:diguanylate cyclase (GGDEF)-like protein/PAS domain S-box-containing protein
MKLRRSIVLIVTICFGLLITVLFVTTRTLTSKKFNDLEDELIKSNSRRSLNAITGITSSLDILVADWANWDDTYKFVQDGNEDYIVSNLPVETFKSQQNNLIILLNSNKELVWGQYLPPGEEKLMPLVPGTRKLLHSLIGDPHLNKDGTGFSGIISLHDTLFIISCKPVLTSNYAGPSTGWLIMAKAIDSETVEELRQRTELDIALFNNGSQSLPDNLKHGMKNNSDSKVFPLIEKTNDSLRCTGQLLDLKGNNVAFMVVTSPRNIYSSGMQVSQTLLMIILSSGALTGLLLLLLLENKILKRIANLNNQVISVQDTDSSSFTPLAGKDEISTLSRSILKMLHILRKNFSELQEMQQFLSTSEERYKTLFMNTGNACVVISEDITIQLANQEFYTIMNIPEGESVENRSLSDFIHPEELERMTKWHYLRRQPGVQPPGSYEIRYIDHNGRIRNGILTVALIPGTSNSSCSLLDITDHKEAEKELKQKAFYDSLTGLPNRQLFNDRLKHAIDNARRNQTIVGVLLLDIDEFKYVNDSLGHHAGDVVLQCIADRIGKAIRTSDTLARLGGDEFVIIIEAPQDINGLFVIADKIIADFITPHFVENHEFHLGVSLGIAVYPDAGENPEELLKNADLAMHESKQKGKNTYHLYTHDLNDKAQRRMLLDRDLRQAIATDNFEVYYQPKVLLDNEKIYGMEALVRGKNIDGSIIAPGEFIPYAEANRLIIPIDLFVLKKACGQTAQWLKDGLGPLIISVNISTKHFRNGDFVSQVANILHETGLPASCLELEITETAMMKDFDQTISSLMRFKDIGVAISLDDFGTGYSSLNYLHNLPIQTLKIDKSFIDHICEEHSSTLELVKIIISIADAMKIKVVAEGVETKDQQRTLQAIGCSKAQGYLFSKPVPSGNFYDLLVLQNKKS